MNARTARALRKHTNEAVRQVAPAVNAALDNEAATRYRVGALEENSAQFNLFVYEWQGRLKVLRRDFWGRLRWLFWGE